MFWTSVYLNVPWAGITVTKNDIASPSVSVAAKVIEVKFEASELDIAIAPVNVGTGAALTPSILATFKSQLTACVPILLNVTEPVMWAAEWKVKVVPEAIVPPGTALNVMIAPTTFVTKGDDVPVFVTPEPETLIPFTILLFTAFKVTVVVAVLPVVTPVWVGYISFTRLWKESLVAPESLKVLSLWRNPVKSVWVKVPTSFKGNIDDCVVTYQAKVLDWFVIEKGHSSIVMLLPLVKNTVEDSIQRTLTTVGMYCSICIVVGVLIVKKELLALCVSIILYVLFAAEAGKVNSSW